MFTTLKLNTGPVLFKVKVHIIHTTNFNMKKKIVLGILAYFKKKEKTTGGHQQPGTYLTQTVINNSYTDTMWSLWKLYKPRRPGL